MSKRYAVLDKDGKVINHILIDDPMPKGYWPGYGATLVPLEPATFTKGGAGLDVMVFDKLNDIPQIGDTLDLVTGSVTKFVPQIVDVVDEKGDTAQVASAPSVKFEKDVAPVKDGKPVVTKEATKGK